MEIGDNIIDIYVTSPDGATKLCYTLNIKRLKRGEEIYYAEKDSSLKSLEITGFPINFESIILDYNIHLKYDQDKLEVKTVATNENAKVDVSSTENLNSGDNIEITVTSEDGSTKTVYMIHISKDNPPKDYRTTIYIGAFVIAITIVIIIILKTNRTNKKNPLLKSKKKNDEKIEPEQKEEVAESPVQTTVVENVEPVVDENFNKVTSNVTTLDLSNAQLPNELQPTVIPNGESVNQDTTNNQQ